LFSSSVSICVNLWMEVGRASSRKLQAGGRKTVFTTDARSAQRTEADAAGRGSGPHRAGPGPLRKKSYGDLWGHNMT